MEHASPPSHDSILDADADPEKREPRYRTLDNILGPASPSGMATRLLEQLELHAVSAEEPSSLAEAEAEADPNWKGAMEDEMKSIEENNTWSLTYLPAGHRAIGLKWVYKLKRDEQGAVVRHKARLIAKGYVQRQGVDFDEVFAPVARLESVHLLLAVAAHQAWEVHHMDVKSAFLNGELQEMVFVQQPPGFINANDRGKVYKLHKALYGLRQAPRAWNTKLDSSLLSLGFCCSSSEHGVYTRATAGKRLIVGVYVDDLIITGDRTEDIAGFKEEMKNLFKMSDLGTLKYYLGIEVTQRSGCITLGQSAYATKILEKAGLQDWNPSQTPMEVCLKLSKNSDSPLVDSTFYCILVGSLRYLVNTRPDLAYAIGYVSRFMETPREEHLSAVRRIQRYVAGTRNWGLTYLGGKEEKPSLLGYSDSDLAGDTDDHRSTSGQIFFTGGSPVTWQSSKQRVVVALSSCEAEYIAAAAACQGVWLARLLTDVLGADAHAPKLMVDNQSTISLVKNPVHHDRTKHVDIKFHYLRECAEQKLIEVAFVGTADQLGDIFTKSLGRTRFHELCSKIGVSDLRQRSSKN